MSKQDFIQPTIPSTLLWPYTAGGLLLYDDMEGVLEWTGSGTGTYTMEQSHNHAYSGDYSLHLKTRAAAVAADTVSAVRQIGITPRKKLLFSVCFLPTSGSDIEYISFNIIHYDGSYRREAQVRYYYETLAVNRKWKYVKSDGTLADITGGNQMLGTSAWHMMSLSIDFVNNQYTELISDGLVMDMASLADYDLRAVALVGDEHLRTVLRIVTSDATQIESYFDLVKVAII